MKAICFTRADGGLSILRPIEGARLAHAITDLDGKEIARAKFPLPVDQFYRRWPVAGVAAEWAETEDEFVARIAKKDVPADATDVRIVEASEIPADRTFREAWHHDGQKVAVHMPKARDIHLNRIRAARGPRLDALDKEHARATGRKKQAEADVIEAERETLRNLPATFDLSKATTPEDLHALWPEGLARV